MRYNILQMPTTTFLSILSLAEKVNFYEQSLIEEALSRTQGSIKSTMDILQLPRKTLYDKMTKYGLSRARFTDTQEGE